MRLRLILAFSLIVFISVTTVVIVARQSAATAVRTFMIRGSMTGVDDLAKALENYYRVNGSWQGAESLFRGAGRGQGMGPGGMMAGMMDQRLRLADERGDIIFDSSSRQVGGRLTSAQQRDSIPLRDGLITAGYLLAEGGLSTGQFDQQALLQRLNRAAITAGLVAGGASLLVALLLAYSLLRPVGELTRASALLAQGDLAQRVPVRGGAELAVLGNTFNQMAASLQAAEQSRRAMTADIAHELRNPLAVQRASLEALQDGIFPLTPESLDPILEQNLLLTRLVEDLRTLALADSGQLSLERTPTDLAALVRKVMERFEPQAASQQVDLQLEVNTTAQHLLPFAHLDPFRVEQILTNLLSNALRQLPAGGGITLSLEAARETVRIRVRDSGPGIPPEALPHLFERFYRAGRSRSRSEGGSGLGLAIARQLAEAHGGSLEAANDPAGGAVFTLTLPLSSKP